MLITGFRGSRKAHVAEAVGNGGRVGLWIYEKRCVCVCKRLQHLSCCSDRQGRIKAFLESP